MLRQRICGDPVLVLDDVFAELDKTRQTALGAVVTEAEQTFITAADDSDLPYGLEASVYEVAEGHVQRRK